MAALSTYLANKLLDHVLNGTAYMSPTLYVALYNTDPGADGLGTEVSGTDYARVEATFGTAASGCVSSNSAAITFVVAGGDWTTANYFGILDASTSGNLLYFGALDTPKRAASGDIVAFGIGAIAITMT